MSYLDAAADAEVSGSSAKPNAEFRTSRAVNCPVGFKFGIGGPSHRGEYTLLPGVDAKSSNALNWKLERFTFCTHRRYNELHTCTVT